jgi:nucleotide-binding universal stress UspA family protein
MCGIRQNPRSLEHLPLFILNGIEKDRKRMKTKPVPRKRETVISNSTNDQRPVESSLADPIVRLKKILVPVDFSDCSQKAVRYANNFAKQFGGELIILHVIEPHPFIQELASCDFENLNDSCQDLQEFQKFIDDIIPSSVSIRTGTPHVKIVEAARGLGADLIIISPHGGKGLNHMFLGSTTEKVLRAAPCPVLVIRECEHEYIADYAWAFEMATNHALLAPTRVHQPATASSATARP